jgi:hypothetical protein
VSHFGGHAPRATAATWTRVRLALLGARHSLLELGPEVRPQILDELVELLLA